MLGGNLGSLLYGDVSVMTSVCFISPYTQLLSSKNGVYRGLHYFLIFALKHRLWVLVSEAVLTCTHDLCFEQK